jgi:hypothetical protein
MRASLGYLDALEGVFGGLLKLDERLIFISFSNIFGVRDILSACVNHFSGAGTGITPP